MSLLILFRGGPGSDTVNFTEKTLSLSGHGFLVDETIVFSAAVMAMTGTNFSIQEQVLFSSGALALIGNIFLIEEGSSEPTLSEWVSRSRRRTRR